MQTTSASSASKRLRVLCLHGFRTNAAVMKVQMRVLHELLGVDAEFTYLDATFEACGPTDPTIERVFADHAPFREWYRISMVAKDSKNGEELLINDPVSIMKARATFDANFEWYLGYPGINETIEVMEAKLAQLGPFDIVVGFSQGAILLTIMSALYWQQRRERPWKLAICVGGPRVTDPQFRSLFETSDGAPIPVPFSSVHVIGKRDPLNGECHKLAGMYADSTIAPSSAAAAVTTPPVTKIVYEHSGGHKFPSLRGNEAFYRDLARVIDDQCRHDGSAYMTTQTLMSASKL